jgi:hypothetical protein
MRKIKSVGVIISGQEGGIQWYTVGEKHAGIIISEIKNVSLEYEDHIYSGYEGYCDKGEILFLVENCPVIVEWYEENK